MINKGRQLARGGRNLLGSQTAKDSSVMFIGNFLNSVLSLVTVVLVSRALGPEQFGILATFTAVSTTLLGLTNFGLDTAAIKIISAHLVDDKRKAAVAMRVVLKLELATGFIIGVAGLFFAPAIAGLLGGSHLTFAVQMAFLAAMFGSAAAFVGPFFVAYRQFFKNATVGLLGGVIRTIIILGLAAISALSLSSVLWAYVTVPVVFFFAGLLIAPKDWRVKATKDEQKDAFKEIFHLSKWILLSYVATVLAGKLDIFLLSRMQGSEAVGLYAAAQQLASIMPLLIGAISTAVLPRFSQFAKEGVLKQYYKKTLFAAMGLAVLLSPVIFLSEFFINLIFGDKYEAAIPVFQILFGAYLIALLGNVLSLSMYALNKPKALTFINYLGLATTIIFYPILISSLGITGAAWAFLFNNLMGTVLSIAVSWRAVKKYG